MDDNLRYYIASCRLLLPFSATLDALLASLATSLTPTSLDSLSSIDASDQEVFKRWGTWEENKWDKCEFTPAQVALLNKVRSEMKKVDEDERVDAPGAWDSFQSGTVAKPCTLDRLGLPGALRRRVPPFPSREAGSALPPPAPADQVRAKLRPRPSFDPGASWVRCSGGGRGDAQVEHDAGRRRRAVSLGRSPDDEEADFGAGAQ